MSERKRAIQYMISKGMLKPCEFIIELEKTIDGLSKNNKSYTEQFAKFYDDRCKETEILKQQNAEYRKLLREVSDILDDAEGYHSGDAMVISEAQEKIEKHLNRPEVKQILERE